MNAAIERLRAEGRIGRDIDLGHLSPALYGHVNPYGKYRFEIEGRAPGLRPLSPGDSQLFFAIGCRCKSLILRGC